MSRSDRILLAAAGGALLLALAAAAVLFVPIEAAPEADGAGLVVSSAPPGPSVATGASPSPTSIVVDVAGAVARPGLLELPAGARIGDALAAAGGYASDADLDAATAALNLAQSLTDGEQVRVPRIGEIGAIAGGPAGSVGGAAAPGAGSPTGGGLVDLNTATPEQLEALPGIGPVTVQKIVAARQEQPFSSLDDAVARGVIHRGQLEDIRELATAG